MYCGTYFTPQSDGSYPNLRLCFTIILCVYNAYLILAFLAAFIGEYVHNMVRDDSESSDVVLGLRVWEFGFGC